MGLFDAMLPDWASKPRLPGWATPPGLPGWATPPGMAPRGGGAGAGTGALVGGGGGQVPGSVLGGGAGLQPLQPLSSLASGALGMFGPGRRYGSPGMPGGGVWGGISGYGQPGQPGAAMPGGGAGAPFYTDPALGAYGAAASNAAINAANPGGADANLPYHQGWETNPGGGYLAGVGNTLAPGRSVTQADADRFVGEVKGLGASDEWIRDFLARNPNDYSRLTNVWHDEFSGGMGDSNDPRTAGQFLGGGTPPGGGGGGAPVAAPGYAPGAPPGGGAMPPWLMDPGGARPQVQDDWGRSPLSPNYGRPPAPGETVPNPAGRGPQQPLAGGMTSLGSLLGQYGQARPYTP